MEADCHLNLLYCATADSVEKAKLLLAIAQLFKSRTVLLFCLSLFHVNYQSC